MKYEYYTRWGMESSDNFDRDINDLGSKGWRLIDRVPAERTSYSQWIFMREIEEIQAEAKIYRNPAYGYGKLESSVARTVDPFHDEGNATNHRISECGPACGKTIRCHDDVVDRVEGLGSL